ncbi:MAG: hypothetical protein KA764_02945, partial [Anaerolineales bacterium]|nr:hypothetical protein [Anaerolineales bacterium]
TLPPSLITWEVLASAANGAAAPDDATLYLGDQAAFRFWPIRPVTWTRVSELTLSLIGSSYGVSTSGTTTPEVALWDFTRAAWVPLDGLQYGVQTVEAPERFVGAGGELRAQLTNRTPDTLNVTSLEFTLTVEP